MIERKDTVVVVLSRNYSTGVSVIRSLGEKGYTVDLVASAKSEGASEMASCSKYVRNAFESVSEKIKSGENPEIINKLLEYKDCDAKALVLLPTDDYTASLVDKNQDVLKEVFKMPGTFASGKDLVTFMNKQVQCQMAESSGMAAPKCWVVSLRDEIKVPEDLVYPCYLKPIESFSGYKREMKTCYTPEEVKEHLEKLKERLADRDFLIQEFLDIDDEIDIEGVAMGDDIVLSGIIHKSIIAKWEVGVPLAGEMVSFDEFPGLKEQVLDLIKAYEYEGMFDLGINIVGGKYYFNEMNLRSGGTNFVYNRCGVNLADLFVQKILGQPVDLKDYSIKEFGKKYLYEVQAYEDLLHDLLSQEEYEAWLDKADIKIMESQEDPAPTEFLTNDFNRRKDRKEIREKIISRASEYNDWTQEEALADLKATKESLGITSRQYLRAQLWKYEPEVKQDAYDEFVERRERKKALRLSAITEAMDGAGWTKEEATAHFDAAEKLTGIRPRDYVKYKFWELTPDEQKKIYEKEIANRAITKVVNDIEVTEEKPLIVVLSRNYSTGLAVIRSLGFAGYPVDLVASAFKRGRSRLAASSKFVLNAVEATSKKVKDGGDEELMDALLAYRGRYKIKPILFATDDYTASIMDMNSDKLKTIFRLPEIVGGGQGSMTEHMSKDVQSAIARKVGLNTPKEWTVNLMEMDKGLPEGITYPCFCKPMESITGYKTEMAKCEDEAALKQHLKDLKRNFAERNVLVQEFLPIDNEIDLGGVCIDQEIIIPAIIKKTRVAQYEKGVTLAGRVVPYEEIGEVAEKTKEMLREFHYVGMFDMEFNVVGDKLYFNEVNLRSGGPNFSYYMSGVNLPEITVKAIAGLPISEEEKQIKEFGKSFIYEKVAWDDHMHGFMTKKELDNAIKTSDIRLLLNPEDPEPGKLFVEQMKRKTKRERIKKCYGIVKSIIQFFIMLFWPIIKHTSLAYPQLKKGNERRNDTPHPRVLCSGRNYLSNLCMAKSLGEAGYEVEVLKIFQKRPKLRNIKRWLKPDARSKYVKAYYEFISNRKPERIRDYLVEIADKERKMLLIPCDDLIASVADAYYDDLKNYYILPNVNDQEGEINRLMEKDVQKQLAKEAGLPVIGSTVVKSVGKKFEIPDTINYPCFIKPNVSKNSSKSKMRRCDSYDELRDTFTAYSANKDFEMIVEDYIDIKREYSILGVSSKAGANGPGYFGAVAGGQKEHRGVAVTGEVIPTSAQKELIDKCVDFISSLNFDGLYDIDLIEDVNGKMYFVEVNMRFGASGYAFTKLGVNLPKMFADYMFDGVPIDQKVQLEKTGDIFVSEKVVSEEYMTGRLTKKEYNKYMDESDIHFIKDSDDTMPYKHYKRFVPILGILRKMYIASGKGM